MLAIKDQINIQIDREEVFRYMGYKVGHKVPARIASLVSSHIRDAYQLIRPQYAYVVTDVESVEGSRIFLGDAMFESQTLAQLMQKCEKAAIFTATIGKLLDRKGQQLAEKGRLLEATIVDAVGSEAVEKVIDVVQSRIEEVAGAQGLNISPRFSPGYCDWDLSQQRVLFYAMRELSTGIRLTDSCLMIPRKSVSGIIGMSQSCDEMEKWSPCKYCERYDCVGRR